MSVILCPECGQPMAKRSGKYGDFLGCTNYPKCKITKPVNWQPAKKYNFIPSAEQTTILEFVKIGKGHGVVEALAGTGKTTTIVESLRHTRGKVLFCAFNKHIQRELEARAPQHVSVYTLHALGFRALKRAFPQVNVDDGKMKGIAKELIEDDNLWYARSILCQVVSLVKATLADATNPAEIEEIVERYGIDMNGAAETVLPLVPQALRICALRTSTIDFDDMVWMPLILGLPLEKYDWVFVDEAQDLNASQVQMVLQSVNPTGRILAVGDRFQSIYGFRGADVNAIPRIIEELQAKTLPLNMTRRCPKSVVEQAQRLVPEIYAKEDAPEGIVTRSTEATMRQQVKDGDLVLCRINAPLVRAAYAVIKRGQKAIIRGRDIGRGLLALIDKLAPNGIVDLAAKLTDYRYKEIARLTAANKKYAIDTVNDKCDTLEALMEGMGDLSELKAKIKVIFDDDTKTGVIFSSIHRAKGDESYRVWIMHPELLPHPRAVQDWQIQQEKNLEYVAITRSKNELIWVDN
jgi:DNA helicase-2/ATP-dependent DNA helicase PcrA